MLKTGQVDVPAHPNRGARRIGNRRYTTTNMYSLVNFRVQKCSEHVKQSSQISPGSTPSSTTRVGADAPTSCDTGAPRMFQARDWRLATGARRQCWCIPAALRGSTRYYPGSIVTLHLHLALCNWAVIRPRSSMCVPFSIESLLVEILNVGLQTFELS